MRLAAKILVLLLSGALLGGCGNGAGFRPDYPVGPASGDGSAKLQFYRRNAAAPLSEIVNVYAGEVVPLEVRGAGPEEKVRWSSSDTGLGAFVKPGELHLRAPGTFLIQAGAGDREVSLRVTAGERDFGRLPSPSPTPSASPSPTPTPSATPSPSPSSNPEPTPDATAIPTPQPSDPYVDQVVSFTPGAG
ncbi:MAG TPA: hypothetical protein VJR29_13175, partial [bacterium]|nr:hypothetical protein [bacterium]